MREIRQTEAATTRHLPAIAITADTRDFTAKKLLTAGSDRFLPKDFDMERLVFCDSRSSVTAAPSAISVCAKTESRLRTISSSLCFCSPQASFCRRCSCLIALLVVKRLLLLRSLCERTATDGKNVPTLRGIYHAEDWQMMPYDTCHVASLSYNRHETCL